MDEKDDSMETSSEDMEEQTETDESTEMSEMAEEQPAIDESEDEDSAIESNQMADDEHPEVEEMESVEETSVEASMEESSDSAPGVTLPAWQQLPITNARTGDSFTLGDFSGKTVFVEPMATWCGNCRRQLTNVREAREQLASDEVVFVALSVETNIDAAQLASYADGEGFEWLFAVLSPELLRELAGEFGQTITNPPSTPHFVIRPDGTTTELVTGIEPAGDILAQITAAQG